MIRRALARRILRYFFDRGHRWFAALSSEDSRERYVAALYHVLAGEGGDRHHVLHLIASARDLLGDRATERDRDFLARLGEVADAHRGAPN